MSDVKYLMLKTAKFDARYGVAISTVTSNTTLGSTHGTVLCDASSGNITITLPAAVSNESKFYRIKKIDSSSNFITIDGYLAETIDGSTTVVLSSKYDSISIVCNGTEWFII